MENNSWYKVDNVAKVFLANNNQRDTRSLRVSATLTEEIEPEVLKKALSKTIKACPQFQVRIRRGLFWHYMEDTDVLPEVTLESERPCPVLYGEHYRGVLHYRVTYFNNRINLDLFHAISDGTGALEFLDTIVLNYLKIKYPGEMEGLTVGGGYSLDEREQDSYSQFADKGSSTDNIPKSHKSYQIDEIKLPYNQLQFMEIHISAGQVVKQARACGVSVGSYMGSRLMLAIYKTMPIRQKKRPITISMPVNLRNFYPSNTSRNFFNSVQVTHVFEGDETIESLSKEFDANLKASLNPELVRQNMNNFQQIEKNLFARVVPLAIKQPVVRFFSKREAKSVTAVLSNLGQRKPPEAVAAHVAGYSAFCSTESVFITLTTYGDELVLGVSSAFARTGYLRELIDSLTDEEHPATVYATEVVK